MDRKTLEAVRRVIERKIGTADRIHKTSPKDDIAERAGHFKEAFEDVRDYLSFELSRFTLVEPAPIDETLSFNDVRKQLDEARAELARIARLATEAIR